MMFRIVLTTMLFLGHLKADKPHTVDFKMDQIRSGKLKPGAVVVFTAAEIQDWLRVQAEELIPEGLKSPRVMLDAGVATGMAQMDFDKLRYAQGGTPNWLLDKLLGGYRPLLVRTTVRSRDGICRVDIERLEVSGIAAKGMVLEVLFKSFVLPLFPDAKVGVDFKLEYGMKQVEIRSNGVFVTMKR